MSELKRALEFLLARETAQLAGTPGWAQRPEEAARPLVFRALNSDGPSRAPSPRIGSDTARPARPPEPAERELATDAPSSAPRPSRPPPGDSPVYERPTGVPPAVSDAQHVEAQLNSLREQEQELSARIEAFSAALLDIATLRARAATSLEVELTKLALDFASVIVEREVALDPALHYVMARTALDTLGDATHARLRVSPAAHEAMRKRCPDGLIETNGVRVALEADPSIVGLGCVVVSSRAQVDGRLDERLRAAVRAVDDEWRLKLAEEAQ